MSNPMGDFGGTYENNSITPQKNYIDGIPTEVITNSDGSVVGNFQDGVYNSDATKKQVAVVTSSAVQGATKATDSKFDPKVLINQVQKNKIETLEFPIGLRSRDKVQSGPYMVIKAYSYKRRIDTKEQDKPLYRICLPMPPNIMQGYSAHTTNFSGAYLVDKAINAFDASENGGIKGAMAGAVVGGVALGASIAATSAIAALLDKMKSQSMAQGIHNVVFGGFGSDARNQISSAAGISINPRYETSFDSMELRRHSFQFPLVPTSREEAAIINKIIRQIRYSIHPSELVDDLLYGYPDKFVVEFKDHMGNTIDSIPHIPDCFISEFTVNSMAGRMHDNDPISTVLNITFTEQHTLTRRSPVIDLD
jgi:hypothetical protein